MADSWFNETYYLSQKAAYNNANKVNGKTTWTSSDVSAAILAAGMTPEQHYLQYGWTEQLSPNADFNITDYENSKAAQLNSTAYNGKTTWTASDFVGALNGTNPFEHYLNYGAYESGVNPSTTFSDDSYYAAKAAELNATAYQSKTNWSVADVTSAFKAAGLTPIGHAATYGSAENLVSKSTAFTTASNDSIYGSYNNDTFSGVVGGSSATFQAGDTLNGVAGTDTLTLNNGSTGTMTVPGATVYNVSNLVLNNNTVPGSATVADVSSWTGLKSVAATGSGATATLTTKSNVTSASVSGGMGLNITDNGTITTTPDTLASVSINGATSVSTITSDALTSLNLTNTNQNVTVNAAAGARTLNVSLNTVTGGTISDTTATAMNITATGAASNGVTVSGAAATTLGITASQNLTAALTNTSALTTVSITGSGNVNLGNPATLTNFGTLSGGSATGAITFNAAAATNQLSMVGGTGNDVLTGGSAASVINGGDGNNTLKGGNAADKLTGGSGNDSLFGAGGNDTLIGGLGSDTIKFSVNSGTSLTNGTAVADYLGASNGAGDGVTDTIQFAGNATASMTGIGDQTIYGFENGTDTIVFGSGMLTYSTAYSAVANGAYTAQTMTAGADFAAAVTGSGSSPIIEITGLATTQTASVTNVTGVTNLISNHVTSMSVVFALTDGTDTYLYSFVGADTNTTVSTTELTQIGKIAGVSDISHSVFSVNSLS